MELQIARQIIDCLAQGVDPVTGVAMPEDSPYNAPPVIRALHAVMRALDERDQLLAPCTRKPAPPMNSGKRWTQQEDSAIEVAFDAGISLKQMAQELGRTRIAVEARLIKLGKIKAPSRSRFMR